MTSLRYAKPGKRKRGGAKKLAWKHFSLYIRLRDSNSEGFARCCTCGAMKHYKQMDAGHFVSGRHDSILFDERGVHAQCPKCNRFLQGDWPRYYEFMRNRFGMDTINDLLAKNKNLTRLSEVDYQCIAREYREKAKELQK